MDLLATIRTLEHLSDRAWPAARTVLHDGWEHRWSGRGLGRRANSVTPHEDGALFLDDKIAHVEAFYREQGVPPAFKMTEAARPPYLDAALEDRGYFLDAPVSVQMLPAPFSPLDGGAELSTSPSPEWLATDAAGDGHVRAAGALFSQLVERIRSPLAFASLRHQGVVAAVGMAVLAEDHIGLFEIATHPDHRRQGLARRVIGSLLAWGEDAGARAAYLQVMEGNTRARSVYQSAGFVEQYRYWYRIKT
jgi:ribosomal protein S18 acetylase RimI-like enzyme